MLFGDLADDGSFEHLGVEWLVDAAATGSLPSMFDRQFYDGTPEETTFLPDHYGLHAWLFTANPDGLSAEFTPTVRC